MINPTSAPTLEDEEKLRLAVVELLSNFAADTILGAQLGTHLNTLLKPNTYKSWLNEGSQNLRTFVETYLNGIVTSTTKRRGNDFLFRIEGKLVTQSFGGALWKAFCTIRPVHSICVKRKTLALYLTTVSTGEATDDLTIAPVSQEEHKAMCQSFIKQLDSHGHAVRQLTEIANDFEHRSYAIWVTALKADGLFGKWGVFRVACIKNLFAERVRALAIEDLARDRLTRDFEADYVSQSAAKFGSNATQSVPAIPPTSPTRTMDLGTRHVLTRALETLDDTHLAKILVPLDVVMALLADRKQ